MCGIAGILNKNTNKNVSVDRLKSMADAIRHRGPDDEGYYVDDYVGLAHVRLSIIDIENGRQPISNSDDTVWLIFNGEIFNYLELRNELLSQGYQFKTKTDTEVIVKLYERDGLGFVEHLNGQFAIALWDTVKKKLVLVRDRVGILPLFYKVENGSVFFASEIKAILKAMKSSPAMDMAGFNQTFYGWSPLPPNTVFEDVKQLLPGQMMVVDKNGMQLKRYWDWSYPESDQYIDSSEDEIADTVEQLLIDATKLRLRSDVPVGAYLSGGLDSSAIVAMIQKYGNVKLRTFSIGFKDKGVDETRYQNLLIEHLDSSHSSLTCHNEDIALNFRNTIYHAETPLVRTAPTPMYLLSGLVQKNKYKVVLTGEGADEVFGGYDIFKESKIRRFWSKNSHSVFRSLLLKRLYPYLDFTKHSSVSYLKHFFGSNFDKSEEPYFGHMTRWDTTSKCQDFLSEDIKRIGTNEYIEMLNQQLPKNINKWHVFNQMQYVEARGLMSGYLLSSQGDRMLMAHSIEGRFPFLDHNLIEYVNRIHPNQKMKVLNEKYILKKAVANLLPSVIRARKKQPYRAPDIPAFDNLIGKEMIASYMSGDAIKKNGYFEEKKVEMLVNKAHKGKAVGFKDNMGFVSILSTQIWHDLFVNK